MSGLTVVVSTPERELEFGPVSSLRFPTSDGWRGVLPGHEPSRAMLAEGPLRLTLSGAERARSRGPREDGPRALWLATEGGILLIDSDEVRLLSRWVAVASSLVQLREAVELREAEREQLEAEARALARRHEVATRRALIALERRR